MRELEFKTGHEIFKLRYDQIYQMKTIHVALHKWPINKSYRV